MRRIILCFLINSILLIGCSDPRDIEGNSIIDWTNFIKVKGIVYDSRYMEDGYGIDEDDIGDIYSTVKFEVADVVFNPSYETQNGDAAFLEKGTKIYRVKGYSPEFRLVAYRNNQIFLYEANTNPKAIKGEDLLPIKDLIESINVYLEEMEGTMKSYVIEDQVDIQNLVEQIMESKINYEMPISGGDNYILHFNLKDGTKVIRSYLIQDNMIIYGIILPEGFKQEFLEAIGE